MDEPQPNRREAGAFAITEVIRLKGRQHRIEEASIAKLNYRTHGFSKAWIVDRMDIDPEVLNRILADDGLHRCVECCYGHHRACMHELNFEHNSLPIPCECGCS